MSERKQIPKVVIAGFGFAGLYAYRGLKDLARKGLIRLQIITVDQYFLFTPLIHEMIGGVLSRNAAIIPVEELVNKNFTEVEFAQIHSIDLSKKRIQTSKEIFHYDYLILGLGSTPDYAGVIGAPENTLGCKNRAAINEIKSHIFNDLDRAQPKLLNIVVVGAGAAGIKVSSAIHNLLRRKKHPGQVTIIDEESTVLHTFPAKIQDYVQKVLKSRGLRLLLNQRISRVGHNYIELTEGGDIPSDLTIWAGGVKATNVEFDQPVARDSTHRLVTNSYLQLPEHNEVYIVGDLAQVHTQAGEQEMLAQAARLQGEYVGQHLAQRLDEYVETDESSTPAAYISEPIGKMVALGNFAAAADLGGLVLTGILGWVVWKGAFLTRIALTWKHRARIMLNWLKIGLSK